MRRGVGGPEMLTCSEMENPGFHFENQWSVQESRGSQASMGEGQGLSKEASLVVQPRRGLSAQPPPALLTTLLGSRNPEAWVRMTRHPFLKSCQLNPPLC